MKTFIKATGKPRQIMAPACGYREHTADWIGVVPGDGSQNRPGFDAICP